MRFSPPQKRYLDVFYNLLLFHIFARHDQSWLSFNTWNLTHTEVSGEPNKIG